MTETTIGGVRDPDSGPLALGAVLADRYRILARLGRGGMGVVYRARDLHLGAGIALKVIAPALAGDPARLEALRAEVRLARRVTHPNVCRIHDLEHAGALWFITMEHVEGESLAAQLARDGAPPAPRARALLRDLARALAAIHAAGVVHRDLKPANILLDTAGRAVIADFGVAAIAGEPLDDIAGTRGFMAPEVRALASALDRPRSRAAGSGAAPPCEHASGPPTGAASRVSSREASDLPGRLAGAPADVHALGAIARLLAGPSPPRDLAAFITRCTAESPAARPDPLAAAALLGPRRPRRIAAAAAALVTGALTVAIAAHAPDPPAAPRGAGVQLGTIDATSLPADQRWLADAFAARLRDELADAWGIPLGDATAPRLDAALARDAAGRLTATLTLDRAALDLSATRARRAFPSATLVASAPPARTSPRGAVPLGAAAVPHDPPRWDAPERDARVIGPHDLAEATAAAIALRVAPGLHPTPAELAEVGASDPEAWRLLRRAQRQALMQCWHRARALAAAALARDPSCTVCALELAQAYDLGDSRLPAGLAAARALPGGAPRWRRAIDLASRALAGDLPLAEIEALLAEPMPDRDRRWLTTRLAFARYDRGATTAALAALERIAEQWPADGAAPKFLAEHHLASDQPGATAAALRWATAAVTHAADDAGARALLARALIRAGRLDDARREAARLDQLDPDRKREIGRQLVLVHLALDELPLAETAARRLATGSPLERAQAARFLGALDLAWGRFAAGLDAITAAAAAYEAAGRETRGLEARLDAATEALALGDLPRARAALAPLTSAPTAATDLARRDPPGAARAPIANAHAAALLALAAGDPTGAAAHASRAPAGPTRDALRITIAAAADRDADALAAFRAFPGEPPIEALAAIAPIFDRTSAPAIADELDRRLVAHPQSWRRPIEAMRARLRLARRATSRADHAAARAHYTHILARWGHAALSCTEVLAARAALE